MFDAFVIFMIMLGAVSGLCTLHINREFFQQFEVHDFFNGRCDSWLYMSNAISTKACCVDVFLRIRWVAEVGWTDSGSQWQFAWLSLHLLLAINAIVFHITTNQLLKRKEFCALCRRKWNFGNHK